MLKQNRSVFIPSLKVILDFDDKDTKEFMISINDKVKVVYFSNGEIESVIGKVISMDPRLSILDVDCSTDCNADIETILVQYINDIDLIFDEPAEEVPTETQ